MIPLHDYFYTFLDLCQHGVSIASEFGFANVEGSHIHDDTTAGRSGGLDRTRICDLLRVKQAL